MKQLRIPFKWMCSIVERGKGKQVTDTLTVNGSPYHLVMQGRGTAKSEMLAYLGLDEPEKDVILSLVPATHIKEFSDALASAIDFHKPGSGIVFTMLPTSVNTFYQTFMTKETEVFRLDTLQYELITVTVQRGLTDLVMDAAKKVGARGGTVLKARSLEENADELTEEQEIILIVAPTERKQEIMQGICTDVLKQTGERVAACSFPISDIMGLKQ